MIIPENLKQYLAEYYEQLPKSRYVSLFLLRTTQSEAIFRTEGSGEGCNREIVSDENGNQVCRAVISKRKQSAVERRQGRQELRKHELLFTSSNEPVSDSNICSMNRNNPCEKCIDCMLYGYAVGAGGAQKSRVITDDAFSLLPFDGITDKKTFNALYENNTMRDPVTNQPSTSIGEDEYIIPGAHFLDIEVLKDVTENELIYVIGNILRSKRYGAITSRIGSVKNTLMAIIGSDTELFSTLEWVNRTDTHMQKNGATEHPQSPEQALSAAKAAITDLTTGICGSYYNICNEALDGVLNRLNSIYADREQFKTLLKSLTESYPGSEG